LITALDRRWTADVAHGRSTTNDDHGLLHPVHAANEYLRGMMFKDEQTLHLFRFNHD
jgi:hypothetical protein